MTIKRWPRVKSACLVIGAMLSTMAFSEVSGTKRESLQPDFLCRDSTTCQMIADYLPPNDLIALMQVAKHQRFHVGSIRRNVIRSSAWSVLVQLPEETLWLDPAEETRWDEVLDILELHPQCFARQSSDGRGLLERLPLKLWSRQIREAVQNGTEPAYLAPLSRLLTVKLLSNRKSLVQCGMSPNTEAKRYAAQSLLGMWGYHNLVQSATDEAAKSVAASAAGDDGKKAAVFASLAATESAAANNAFKAAKSISKFGAPGIMKVTIRAAAAAAAANAIDAARVAAEEAIQQWLQDAPENCRPSADLIGRAAYRTAEMTVHFFLIRHLSEMMDEIRNQTAAQVFGVGEPSMFDDSSSWQQFKSCTFPPGNQEIGYYEQPWLTQIDCLFDH